VRALILLDQASPLSNPAVRQPEHPVDQDPIARITIIIDNSLTLGLERATAGKF